MSPDYVAAFAVCVALASVMGACRPWKRFAPLRETPWPVRAMVLGAVAAGFFLLLSLFAGLFYFLSGPTSPTPIAIFATLLTLLAALVLSTQDPA